MTKNRVAIFAAVAVLIASWSRAALAADAEAAAAVPQLDLPSSRQTPAVDVQDAAIPTLPAALPASVMAAAGAYAAVPGAYAPAAAIPLSPAAVRPGAIAELHAGAASLSRAAAQGSPVTPGQVSRKLFDAQKPAGGDDAVDASAAAPGAGASESLPDQAYFSVVPEVIFPGVTRIFAVNKGREQAMRQLHALSGGRLLCATEREQNRGGVLHGLFPIATLANMRLLEDKSGLKVAYTGLAEAKIEAAAPGGRLRVSYPKAPELTHSEKAQLGGYIRKITRIVTALTNEHEGLGLAEKFDSDPVLQLNRMIDQASLGTFEEQELLGSQSLVDKAKAVADAYSEFAKNSDVEHDAADPEDQAVEQQISHNTSASMEKDQREYILRKKREAIDRELNGGEEGGDPALKQIEKKFAEKKASMSQQAVQQVERELRHAKGMNPGQGDYQMTINYLEWLTDMPWGQTTKDSHDLKKAKEILDSDHYGIEDVKGRVIEFLAVRKALAREAGDAGDHKGIIMAFDGPPGVGKTSVAESIAKALGRKYIRISLAGLHDEAEIRGHRRTYVGAMPGRIVQAIKQAGVNNPVVLIDEIDKVGSNNGEPGRAGNAQNALVELLDPAQNKSWHDNYLDVDYDLSKVLFIGTSNDLKALSQPVLDRLDIIPFSSYIEEEKLEIAKRHLARKQLKDNGFKPGQISFTDGALLSIIRGYTHEGGVRQLERTIGKILRKIQTDQELGVSEPPKVVDAAAVKKYLGEPLHVDDRFQNGVGVASGLYWSAGGGGVLMIETGWTPKGSTDRHFSVTGNIAQVMQESSQIALRNAMRYAEAQGVDPRVFTTHDFDVHVPEGATPKDGPSAGITMTTALVSLFTGRAVKQGFAMTGEISRTGRVMPIGGLKEKSLGALRMGYTDIIIPKGNEKDLQEIPASARAKLRFHPVENIEQVLDLALEKSGTPMKPAPAEGVPAQSRRHGF